MIELKDKFNRLKQWIIDNKGIVNDKLEIKTHDKFNRLIIANQKIEKDEIIVDIPNIVCINKDKFNTLPNSDKIDITPYNHTIVLTMILLHHISLKESSFFYPYIDLLPSFHEFAYHPVYLYNEEIGKEWNKISPKITKLISLHVTNVFEILKVLLDLNRIHQIYEKSVLTYDNVKWCYLLLITRQWNNSGLVPVADLFQHSCKSGMLLMPINNGQNNIMTTKEEINEGMCVYDNYGVYDDILQFTSFGFIENMTEDNCSRFIKIIFNKGLNKVETSLDRFKNAEIDKYTSVQRIFYLNNTGIQNYILEYLRLYFLDEYDLKIINVNETYYDKMISLSNESKVFSGLLDLAKNNNYISDKMQIDYCNEICTKYPHDTIEYKIARITLLIGTVIQGTINLLLAKWNSYLVNPFNTKISIDIYQ